MCGWPRCSVCSPLRPPSLSPAFPCCSSISAWNPGFSDRVRTAVTSSSAVAQAYLNEHLRTVEADALWIAGALNRDAPVLAANPQLLERVLVFQVGTRNLSEALVFEETGRILGRAGFTIVLEFEPIPTSAFDEARTGEVVILRSEADDRVRALIRLDSIIDTFLIVGRSIDSSVLAHVEETEGAYQQFERLETERSRFQVSFALAFVMVALLLLLTAVWVGLNMATGLSGADQRSDCRHRTGPGR